MQDDEDLGRRKTPPDGPDDWQSLWDGNTKAHKLWNVLGWSHAVLTNWKALAVVAVAVGWFNRPGISEAIRTLTGGGP